MADAATVMGRPMCSFSGRVTTQQGIRLRCRGPEGRFDSCRHSTCIITSTRVYARTGNVGFVRFANPVPTGKREPLPAGQREVDTFQKPARAQLADGRLHLLHLDALDVAQVGVDGEEVGARGASGEALWVAALFT